MASGTGFVFAQPGVLEITYPTLPFGPPPERISYLPFYIRYVYYFTITFIGILILGLLIKAGVRYLSSAGNPEALKDAKNQILSAFLGLLIIFGTTIILRELNPQFLTLTPPALEAYGRGIIIYTDQNCGQGSGGLPGVLFPLPEGVRYEKVEYTESLEEFFTVRSFFTFNSHGDIIIRFFDNPDCRGGAIMTYPNDNIPEFNPRTCIAVDPGITVSCVEIIWKSPGVYLSNAPNFRIDGTLGAGENFIVYKNSVSNFPNWLHNNVRSVALVRDADRDIRYGTI